MYCKKQQTKEMNENVYNSQDNIRYTLNILNELNM